MGDKPQPKAKESYEVTKIKAKIKEIQMELASMARHPANDVKYRGKKELLIFRKQELEHKLAKMGA